MRAVHVRLAEQHARVVRRDSASRSCRCRRRRRRSRAMISSAFSDVSRVSCVSTCTCGLRSRMPRRAPTRASAARRRSCRAGSGAGDSLTSTTSKSTSPSVPTPAAARYSAAGEPSPPAPMSSTRAALSSPLPVDADVGQDEMPAVPEKLIARQRRQRGHCQPPHRECDTVDLCGHVKTARRPTVGRRRHLLPPPHAAIDASVANRHPDARTTKSPPASALSQPWRKVIHM